MEADHARDASRTSAAVVRRVERTLREDALADLVVVLVEDLDDVEVAVDDDVEQPVEQETDAMDGEIRRTVPTGEHGVDREPVVLADGDEPTVVDEGVDLGLVETAAVGVDAHRVAGQEEMRGIRVELGSLMGAERVLDRELVQAEFTGQLVKLRPSREHRSPPTPPCRAAPDTPRPPRAAKPSASSTPFRYTLVLIAPTTRSPMITRPKSRHGSGDVRFLQSGGISSGFAVRRDLIGR